MSDQVLSQIQRLQDTSRLQPVELQKPDQRDIDAFESALESHVPQNNLEQNINMPTMMEGAMRGASALKVYYDSKIEFLNKMTDLKDNNTQEIATFNLTLGYLDLRPEFTARAVNSMYGGIKEYLTE